MRIERVGQVFRVARGREPNESYFSFFVDDDKSSWSNHEHNGRIFKTENDAADCIVELKRRAKLQRSRAAALRGAEGKE